MTQKPHAVLDTADYSGRGQCLDRDRLLGIKRLLVHGLLQPANVDLVKVLGEQIVETALWQTAVNWHLPALEALDGYARADILAELYAFDNSDFLNFLQDQGFRIASESTSNYIQTHLSMSSALNMSYLDDIAVDQIPAFETDFHRFVEANHPEIFSILAKERDISDTTEESIKASITEFKQGRV